MSDSDDLRVLVELAARGELSDAESAEVEELIADKPDLLAEYERLRFPTSAPADAGQAPGRPSRASNQSGCLLAIAGFIGALIVVSILGIMLRPGDANTTPSNPVDAVLDDPDNEVLVLEGPTDLVEFGRLALMYSPSTGDAVLLGNDIPNGGALVGREERTLATFEAGDVQELIENLDPDQNLRIVVSPPTSP